MQSNYAADSKVFKLGVQLSHPAKVPGAIQEALGDLRHLHGAGRCDTGSTGNLCPSGMTDGGQVGYPRVSQMALGVSSVVLRDTPKYTDS